MCERIRNSMDTTGSTKIPFENFYGEKPKIVGLFSEFGRIGYVTKQEIFMNQITDKTFKVIMVGYAEKQRRDTYKLYNPDNNRVIMTRDVKWADCKITDPEETLKMLREAHKEGLVKGIEENNITASEPEYNTPVHIITNEVESVRLNENA